MTASQIFAGLALIVGLAVACQVIAARFGIPGIILLLPAGFAAGAATTVVNPDRIFGAAWPPLVSLAVAIILFDGGLDLVTKGLEGDSRRVVRRLRGWGIPMTWAGAGFFGGLLLGLSSKAAPERLVRIFLDDGPAVTRLARAATGSLGTESGTNLSVALGSPPRPRGTPRQPAAVLTERELLVLRFLPSRLTNAEIARECLMSVNTVKTHLKRIYAKLGVSSRAETVERARLLGLL